MYLFIILQLYSISLNWTGYFAPLQPCTSAFNALIDTRENKSHYLLSIYAIREYAVSDAQHVQRGQSVVHSKLWICSKLLIWILLNSWTYFFLLCPLPFADFVHRTVFLLRNKSDLQLRICHIGVERSEPPIVKSLTPCILLRFFNWRL